MTPRRPTPSQTVGPFFGFALRFAGDAAAVAPGSPGALHIEGRVLDGEGAGVPDALVESWSGDQFARCRTDREGSFRLWLRTPEPGPGHPPPAPHIELIILARGLLRHLATRVYLPDEEDAQQKDPVLQKVPPDRRHTLIARRDPSGSLLFDVRLQGQGETVFFAI